MSQPLSEEPDPLLAFPTESTSTVPPDIPAEPGMQPEIEEDVPPSASALAQQAEPKIERLDRIEQTLDQSRKEILTLASEIATLVGSIADINRRMGRPKKERVHIRSVISRTGRRTGLAFAGVFVVATAGIVRWPYWSNGGPPIPAPIEQVAAAMPLAPAPTAAPTAAPPAKPPAKPLAPGPAAAPPSKRLAPGPTAAPPSKPPAAAPTAAPPAIALAGPPLVTPRRVSERAAPVVKRVNYVGTLSIDSAPGGDVLIDRETAGRTPLQVANVRAGSHLIWIEREGYRRWTRVVTVSADRVSRVTADLEPIAPR